MQQISICSLRLLRLFAPRNDSFLYWFRLGSRPEIIVATESLRARQMRATPDTFMINAVMRSDQRTGSNSYK